MIDHAWLITVVPLASFFLILLVGKRFPGKGADIGILAVTAAFVMSIIVVFQQLDGGDVTRSWTWFEIVGLSLDIGYTIDGLSAMMLVVVTTVSLVVHVYSLGYMRGDRRFTFYYAVLSLFTGSMLNLVLAVNLFQLLVGWELVGLCSYLLIGHWWEDRKISTAAIKAFLTTKTGDVPFVFGIFALTVAAGTASIPAITGMVDEGAITGFVLTASALLLFGGAIGKSAQFPLHTWLPDAMAGPTPVSALIHAATMVVAGVYLVGRMFTVFVHASPEALNFVAAIGGVTMLMAALMAAVQDDIKRVLAYSTVSQLAYMMAALGLGEAGFTPAFFHLFTHAFFKALLFLVAGAIIHAVHTNNMSEMGGLRRSMPLTFWTFVVGAAALGGIPPLAGFWSKDEILTEAWRTGQFGVWAVAFITAGLTAFYMARAVLLTFFGRSRVPEETHPHDPEPVMMTPLVALAGLSVVIGFVGAPFVGGGFGEWVHFGGEAHEAEFVFGIAASSIAIALLGFGVGYAMYARWRAREPLSALGPAYVVVERKFYLDDLYFHGIVHPIQFPIARVTSWLDRNVIDFAVNAVGWLTRRFARGADEVDRQVIDGAVNGVGVGTNWTGGLLRYLQSGNVQRYAALLFAGVAILAVIFTRT